MPKRQHDDVDKAFDVLLWGVTCILLWLGLPFVLSYAIVGLHGTEAEFEAFTMPFLVIWTPIVAVTYGLVYHFAHRHR